jgi:hypothetical protein
MTAPESSMPGNRPRREPADPLQMSLAEKLACEWEARHDVAARGKIADVAPVQHYLTHTRCEDHRHPQVARAPRAHEQRTAPSALSGWLRWGDDGRTSSGSVLPRGC